ncbi:unnamed protein product [Litomosoides sigmodontis]|uniref:AAA+ ATPase domain-containing protein n=1 Tax=Litomosoides sigmodontis TaxID=42156 RepID=A0A3P6V1F7_LITSI|nr:unnamed protein product [Litomosoides sigmodontis]
MGKGGGGQIRRRIHKMKNTVKFFIKQLSSFIWTMIMRSIPKTQQAVAPSNPSFHAEIRLAPTIHTFKLIENVDLNVLIMKTKRHYPTDLIIPRDRCDHMKVIFEIHSLYQVFGEVQCRKWGNEAPSLIESEQDSTRSIHRKTDTGNYATDIRISISELKLLFGNESDVLPWRNRAKKDAEKLLPEIHEALLSIENVRNGRPVVLPTDKEFSKIISSVFIVSSDAPEGEYLAISKTSLTLSNLHLYKLLNRDAQTLEAQSGEHDSEPNTAGSLLWELPCFEFDGLWENLIFDDSIKDELLSYVYALAKLSEKNANSAVLRVNRLILLHGPPGTGKTSLCKALAQKLAIRFSQKYGRIYFVEINSHGLFSKFFSESGKLIHNMFRQIEELAEDPKAFVFVLIDEVESLTTARSASLNRNEPTDAIRAVNAVLTQVDHIRRRNNIFIFTTSNITQSLDEAFTDRTDLSRFIGYPSANAVYAILCSCIQEMQRIGIVESSPRFPKRYANDPHCERLMQLSRRASGLSGRCLRQLPITGYSKLPADQLSVDQCINVLEKALKEKCSENVRRIKEDRSATPRILHGIGNADGVSCNGGSISGLLPFSCATSK